MQWTIEKIEQKVQLDKRDQKLIETILMSARTSLKEIAKRLRISKPAVLKRIQKLENSQVIQGYSCFINFNALGLKTYQIGIKVNMGLEQKEKYLLQLIKCVQINQVLSLVSGRWDFLCRITCFEKDLFEILDEITHAQVQKTDILQMYHGFFCKEEKICILTAKEESVTKEETIMLKELANNGKVKLRILTEKTGLSEPTIKKTLNKLEKENILLAYVTKINPLMYGRLGFLLVITTKTRAVERNISKTLARVKSTGVLCNIQYPNIISFHLIESLKDMKEIEAALMPFKEEISSYEFIEIIEQRKYEFFPEAIEKMLQK